MEDNQLDDFRPVKVIDLDQPDNRDQAYSQINLVPSVLTKDTVENFNFRGLFSSKNSLATFPGLDLFQLQSFEQLFFSNFNKVKTSFKRFKGKSRDCQAQLKSLEDMADILAQLNQKFNGGKKSISRSGLANPIQELNLQFKSLMSSSLEILNQYKDGIDNLKRQPLHPMLQTEKEKCLMDIYYKEDQMNSFRDSLKRQLDKMRGKIEGHLAKHAELENKKKSQGLDVDQDRLHTLKATLSDEFQDEIEPLAISIVNQVSSDLTSLHKNLEVLQNLQSVSQSEIESTKEYFKDPKKLKMVISQHSKFIEKLEGYTKDIDSKLIAKIQSLKSKLSKDFIALKDGSQTDRTSYDAISQTMQEKEFTILTNQLLTEVQKLVKDFLYLKKPSILPRAYDLSLKEMRRRQLFKKGFDQIVAKLKVSIDKEKDKRTSFINTQIQYLPSHFWPQLKDMPQMLVVEGSSRDHEFPDLRSCSDITCEENLFD